MREGGRIPIREEGKHSSLSLTRLAVFLFLSLLLFLSLFQGRGLQGWVLLFSLLFLLAVGSQQRAHKGETGGTIVARVMPARYHLLQCPPLSAWQL
jgi:hypothetical protein